MPGLTTIERHNHSKWRSLYYGANVMGDDAAMYQNSQRFIVRNDFDEPIYFRVFEQ
jgi:vancomycin resistance protein YoaR